MIKIINSLFFRLTKTSLMWILLAICVGLPLFNALIIFGASGMLKGLGLEEAGLFDTLALTGQVASISSDCMILIIVGVALFFGSEFSNGTIRNAVLSNKSRTEIFFAYAIVGSVISIAFVTAYLFFSFGICGLILGFGNYSAGEVVVSLFTTWGLGLLSGLVICFVTLFFVVTTKSKALSIFLPILIQSIPGLLYIVVGLGVTLGRMTEEAAAWIPFVNYNFYNGAVQNGMLALKITLSSVVLAGGFGVGGFFILKKTDLK